VFTLGESPPFRAIFVPGKKNLRRLTGVKQENVPQHGANRAPLFRQIFHKSAEKIVKIRAYSCKFFSCLAKNLREI
jgi:hypothetical protein